MDDEWKLRNNQSVKPVEGSEPEKVEEAAPRKKRGSKLSDDNAE